MVTHIVDVTVASKNDVLNNIEKLENVHNEAVSKDYRQERNGHHK